MINLPEWASTLTTCYPAAKWEANYFEIISKHLYGRNFADDLISQAVDGWILSHPEPYQLPTVGQLVRECEKILSALEVKSPIVDSEWHRRQAIARRRQAFVERDVSREF